MNDETNAQPASRSHDKGYQRQPEGTTMLGVKEQDTLASQGSVARLLEPELEKFLEVQRSFARTSQPEFAKLLVVDRVFARTLQPELAKVEWSYLTLVDSFRLVLLGVRPRPAPPARLAGRGRRARRARDRLMCLLCL